MGLFDTIQQKLLPQVGIKPPPIISPSPSAPYSTLPSLVPDPGYGTGALHTPYNVAGSFGSQDKQMAPKKTQNPGAVGTPPSPAHGEVPNYSTPAAPSGPVVSPTGSLSSPVPTTTGASPGTSGDFLSQLIASLGPAPQMPSYDPAQLAQQQIALKYGSSEGALNRAIQQAGIDYGQQESAAQNYGNTGDTRLQAVYQALQNDLGRGQQASAQNYDQTRGEVGSTYDQAAQALQQLNSGINQQLGGSADQLGILQGLQGTANPLARIAAAYQQMAGSNIQNKAMSLGGLDVDKANEQALQQNNISSAQKQGATARGDLALQTQAALAQLGLGQAKAQTDLQGQYADLEKGKGADLANTQMQLASNLYGMQRQSRLDQLAELVQLGTLDTQRTYMGAQVQNMGAQQQIAAGQLQLAAQKQALDQQIQVESDPIKQQQLIAQVNQLNAQAQYYQQHGDYFANGGTAGAKQMHPDLMQQFLSTPQDGLWGPEGAGPKFAAPFTGSDPSTNVILDAEQKAKTLGGDPFTIAMAELTDPNKVPATLNKAGLQKALSLYFRGQ